MLSACSRLGHSVLLQTSVSANLCQQTVLRRVVQRGRVAQGQYGADPPASHAPFDLQWLRPRFHDSFQDRWWGTIAEHVFSSPFVVSLFNELEEQCLCRSEWKYISLDATAKAMMSFRGQENYRMAAALRSAQPITDADALCRILTCKGSTGCILLASGVHSESAEAVSEALRREAPPGVLEQVPVVGCDNPSAHLEETL